jgi:hypothetical protein
MRQPIGRRSEIWQCDKDKGADLGLQERRAEHAQIHIDRAVVEQVESFKFLGVTNKLS